MSTHRVKTSCFCGLSSQPKLHSFLRDLDSDTYDWFMKSYAESTGCAYNSNLMMQLVDDIRRSKVKYVKLLDFLKAHFPSCVADSYKIDPNIFINYRDGVPTIPRRSIMIGITPEEAFTFCRSKGKSMFLHLDGVAYLEYLEKKDNISQDGMTWILESYPASVVVNKYN